MSPLGDRPQPLRRRLVAVVVAVAAAVCLVVGTITLLSMRATLLGQIDERLAATADRALNGPERDGTTPGSQTGTDTGTTQDGATRPSRTTQDGSALPSQDGLSGPPPFLGAMGQGAGTVGVIVVDGAVQENGYIDQQGQVIDLTDAQAAVLRDVPADGRPHTVDLAGLGRFRVQAVAFDAPAAPPAVGSATASPTAAPTPTAAVSKPVTTLPPDGAAVSSGMVVGLSIDDVDATVRGNALVAALVSLLGVGLAAVVGSVVVRRTLAPLGKVAATATRVSQLPLDRGEVQLAERVPADLTDERTEVGQVGAALNRLLGHVEDSLAARHASEQQVRRFVADASHELRTPLASIRGYAELVRRRPGHALPEDVRTAVGRVESESVRMSCLVEDLLLLARLDAERELAREPVDLSEIVVAAVADAHAAGPDHRWQLHLPQEAVEVVGDAGALHQVVTNLLSNARTHTPAGTTVQVELARRGARAELVVHDDGPGIDPDLMPRLFDRFSRGEVSRHRGSGASTGLGLAIVQALVAAHGGTIRADGAGGATFTVRLPVGGPPQTGRAGSGAGTDRTGSEEWAGTDRTGTADSDRTGTGTGDPVDEPSEVDHPVMDGRRTSRPATDAAGTNHRSAARTGRRPETADRARRRATG